MGRSNAEKSIGAVVIIAKGTRWERRFDLGVVAYAPPKKQWFKRLLWSLKRPLRRWRRARIERVKEAYRARIIREGWKPPG